MLRFVRHAAALTGAAVLFSGMMIGTVMAWDVRQASSNLDILTLSEVDLATRKIKSIAMGDLQVPTGEIVACDVLVNPEKPALARKVSPGVYPVTLYQAQGRIALAALRVSPGIPVSWELATIAGQDIATLKDGEIFGYPVDAGTGSFFDKSAYPLMQEREKREKAKTSNFSNYYDDVLAAEYDEYVMHRPLPENPVNVAVFHSGWGDGFYASFWGLDVKGKPLVLLTDFGVMHNGDGRDYGELAEASAKLTMSPQQLDDSRVAYEAMQRDDLMLLQSYLTTGRITPETYISPMGYGFTYEAINLRKPKALELLIRYGARPEVPRGMLKETTVTYPAYVRQMAQFFSPSEPAMLGLLDVVTRWESGAIPLADDAPGRQTAK